MVAFLFSQPVHFDCYTARPLERAALQRLLPWLKSSTVLQDQPGTFTVLSAGGALRLRFPGERSAQGAREDRGCCSCARAQQPGSKPERATALNKGQFQLVYRMDRRAKEAHSTLPRPEAPPTGTVE